MEKRRGWRGEILPRRKEEELPFERCLSVMVAVAFLFADNVWVLQVKKRKKKSVL